MQRFTVPIIQRQCACGCGGLLPVDARSTQKYLTDKHRMSGRQKTRPFVALDGEGADARYMLLACRDKAVSTRAGLSTEECLDFLLDLPRGSDNHRKPIYVWFAFDYDVNMMLRDIPLRGENSLETLKDENTIRWRGYRITYIRRKIFRIARGKHRHTSYDVWGFFQSNFEQACKDWQVDLPEVIHVGKEARGNFNRWSLKRLTEYNAAELVALEELCEKLRESVQPLELPIQSWHGPAALAGAWLQKNKVKGWKDNDNPIPMELVERASQAYFGGRIDVLGYGFISPVYHYDIVSAYPAATRNLPNLSKLEWKNRQGAGVPRGRLYVARIRWRIPATYWPPFPWRSSNGSIRYPLEGEGWYWNYEVEAAQEKYGDKYFKIVEYWEPIGELEFPFRNLIQETFKLRAALKAENHPSHKAVKLVLNSLYGKFAQTVGRATYNSPIWAGLITSETRAKLMTAISDDVVCVMTDSIWSSQPLTVPIGDGLGDWEQQDESELWLAEAGLYTATAPGKDAHTWQRGFDKRNPVDIPGLVQHWLTDDPAHDPIYEVTRFVGMGLALHTSLPHREFVTLPRQIHPVPFAGTTKRLPVLPMDSGTELDKRFVRMLPRPADTKEVSAPYKRITFDANLVQERLEDECSEE